MLSYVIEPRSSETNATGHIDHTVIPVWFELARTPIYKLFNPDMSFSTWNTVIRKMTVDYLGQVFHNRKTEVRTVIGGIKNTSFTVIQELWQDQTRVAIAETVLVYFDYKNQRKLNITPAIQDQLTAFNRKLI
ncbi:MAG: hypothetical protein A3G96_04435 [Gammaproteobacteria bacterium RIFCSPLOWO2_12_FULL_52_10]|nr:MAG: hypothetical protein A3G96_04435 [Gammaproteobacteria bacterium RIFCSPLOWO2_12_FULL_52_10]